MLRIPRLALIALVLVAALVASGCGSGDRGARNAYIEQVNQAQSTYAGQVEVLAPRVTQGVRMDAAALAQLADATTKTAAKLDAIKPPAKVRGLHADLVSAVTTYATAVSAAQDSGGGANAQSALKVATTRLSDRLTDVLTRIGGRLRG